MTETTRSCQPARFGAVVATPSQRIDSRIYYYVYMATFPRIISVRAQASAHGSAKIRSGVADSPWLFREGSNHRYHRLHPKLPAPPPTGGCNQAIGTGAHRTATTRAWGVPAPNSPTRVVLPRLRRRPMARQVRRVVVAPVPLVVLPAAPVQARRSRLQLTITRDRCVTRVSMRCSLIPPNRLTRCWRVCVWLCMGATGGQAGQED